jgi:hypothetical protein
MHQHTAVVAIFIKYKDELGRALMEDLRPSQSVPKECAETLDIYPILDLRAPIFNLSALSMAARNGDLALAKLLVENGATVDSPSHHRSTPIMSAVSHDFRDIVNLLLEASANINARDSDNHSVLWYAQTNEMRELLQQRGAHY